MRALRSERYKFRDEQFAKIGLPAPRQGVPGYEALLRWERDYYRYADPFEDDDGT